ncbi:MAG TPA: DUF3616 domain-containing protein [Geminicoccaceae bacterium]|nr:DUF3616 domain-containing protein [Geminicoccaceae bacterium]
MSQSEPGAGAGRRGTMRRTAARTAGRDDAAPVRRLRLDFRHHGELALADAPVRGDLSAAAIAGDTLWVANDEFPTVERLVPIGDGVYGEHRAFALGTLFDLPGGHEGEMDIEGLEVDGGYLWVVGSHSLTREKPKPTENEPAEALAKLNTLRWQPNRAFLGRVPLVSAAGEGEGEAAGRFELGGRADGSSRGRRPACLRLSPKRDRGGITREVRGDEHLAAFLGIPAKENGLDIEGIAVRGERVLVGMRGPVLRGWALILELEIGEPKPGRLKPRRIGRDGERYGKHFLNLDGLGIRDLTLRGDDLLILAGPTMDLSGPAAVFRWADALGRTGCTVVPRQELERLIELPEGVGEDHPEGIAVIPGDGEGGGADLLLVVYDSPAGHRLHDDGAGIDADLFELPLRQ